MKNFTLGLNIVLAIAVAVLFYLHFSSKKTVGTVTNSTAVSGGFKIGYFDMDSVQNQFEYFKDVRSVLNSKDQELGRELATMENNFRNKYQDLQKRHGHGLNLYRQTVLYQLLRILKPIFW